MSPELVSVLTSKTMWLALLTAIVPPLLRLLGIPEASIPDETLAAFAGLAVAIAGARLTTTSPVHRRLKGQDQSSQRPSG